MEVSNRFSRRVPRNYAFPIAAVDCGWAYPLGDGFIIAILYGAQSNCVRNVVAAGEFTLWTKGS